MSEQPKEPYTIYDEALDLKLLTGAVMLAINRLYTDKRIALDVYNTLYDKAREADRAAVALRDRLGKVIGS